MVDGGHLTIDTFLIRPRFWKKVAQHGQIIEDALYFEIGLKPAVVSCFTNALAPLLIALERERAL